jgi:hypothetical protein
MNATLEILKPNTQKWIVIDGDDAVHCWLDEDGFHSKRYSSRQMGMVVHKVETLEWSKLIEKSEGQLPLPL